MTNFPTVTLVSVLSFCSMVAKAEPTLQQWGPFQFGMSLPDFQQAAPCEPIPGIPPDRTAVCVCPHALFLDEQFVIAGTFVDNRLVALNTRFLGAPQKSLQDTFLRVVGEAAKEFGAPALSLSGMTSVEGSTSFIVWRLPDKSGLRARFTENSLNKSVLLDFYWWSSKETPE